MSAYPLNPRALQIFRLIVEKGSLAAAARAVHLSPPAASRLIGQLEQRLDMPLFSREQRRLRLTREGEAFFREAAPVLDGLQSLPAIARGIRRDLAADLSVVTSAPLGIGWVSPALRRLAGSEPGIKTRIDLRSRFELESSVALRRYELGIASLPISNSLMDIVAHPLARVRMTVTMHRSHPLAARRRVTASELAGQSIVALSAGQLWRERADSFLAAAGLSAAYAMETTSSLMSLALCRHAIGLTFSDPIFHNAAPSRECVARAVEPPHWIEYGYLVPAGHRPTAAQERLLDALRAVIRGLRRGAPAGCIEVL